MPGLLKLASTELAKYNLYFMLLDRFWMNKLGTEWAGYFTIYVWKGKLITIWGQDLLFTGVKYQYLSEFTS